MAKKKSEKNPKSTVSVNSVEDVLDTTEHSFTWRDLFKEPIALGLGLLIILRPWRDGITFPSLNIYFTFFIFLLTIIYAISLFRNKQSLEIKTPLVLLCGFVLVCFYTLFSSVHVDASLRGLIQQLSYLFVFILSSQALRSKFSMNIVLTGVIIGLLINTLWSVIHANYVLPYVRETISNTPSMLQYYFQSDELSAETKHRLEMGRAFGTFLFPNALGGFMALCLPYVLGELLSGWRQFKHVLYDDVSPKKISVVKLTVLALVASLCMSLYVFGMNRYLQSHTSGQVNLIVGNGRVLYYYIGFPLIFGAFSGYLLWLKGSKGFGVIIRSLSLCLLFPLISYCLWSTFSRGAWLGTCVGLAVAGALVVSAFPKLIRINPVAQFWLRVSTVLICCSMVSLQAPAELKLEDDGFLMPNPGLTWQTENVTHEASELRTEGVSVDVDDVLNTTSLQYRLSYWKVSLLMVRAHSITGVGLGNYGLMYGHHQFMDAYDVKMAHNDYLQIAVETGMVGVLFFIAFWLYFIVWGGAHILREQNLSNRLALAGLYAGVLAFLVQAFFDFNFMNPSLATFAYVFAGLFYARVRINSDDEKQNNSSSKVLASAVLLIVCISTYAGIQQFRYDFGRTAGDTKLRLTQLGDERRIKLQVEVTKYLLSTEVQTFDAELGGTPGNPNWVPRQPVSMLKELIHSDTDLLNLGQARRLLQDGSGNTRLLGYGEKLLDTDYIFILHPTVAQELAYSYSKRMLDRLQAVDEIYPYGAFICKLSADWIHILNRHADSSSQKLRYAQQMLAWAEKRVERNPEDPGSHVDLSKAYLERGQVDQSAEQLNYYRKAIKTYTHASQMYPTAHDVQQNYGHVLTQMGTAFSNAGLNEEGNRYLKEGEEAYNRARWLARYKQDVLNLR